MGHACPKPGATATLNGRFACRWRASAGRFCIIPKRPPGVRSAMTQPMEQKLAVKLSPEPQVLGREDRVEMVVRRLNSLCKKATLGFALAVGKLIIEQFYGGKALAWRSRDPRKDVSLRKLARHPDLPMSAGALYRCVAIYELCERINIDSWHHISSSHLRLVLPLPPDQQTHLLRRCEEQKWTSRRLDEEVAAVLARHSGSGTAGVRRQSRVLISARRLTKAIEALADSLESAQTSEETSPETIREVLAAIQRANELCGKMEGRAG